jgi:hypothetical protein
VTNTVLLTTLVSLLVGMVLPALTAVVTKEHLPAWIKQAVLLLLATVTGVLTSLIGAVPTTVSGWLAVLTNIALTFVAALAAQFGLWEHTGAGPAITRATARFGIGPKPPPAA